MSGSVKYFIEMLMEAEAHQQPSLSSSMSAAATFLGKLDGEDLKTPRDSCAGEVIPASFLQLQLEIGHAITYFVHLPFLYTAQMTQEVC